MESWYIPAGFIVRLVHPESGSKDVFFKCVADQPRNELINLFESLISTLKDLEPKHKFAILFEELRDIKSFKRTHPVDAHKVIEKYNLLGEDKQFNPYIINVPA